MAVTKEIIQTEMQGALKANDDLRKTVLRSVLGEITKRETASKTRTELDTKGVESTMRALVKQRRETAQEYRTLGAIARAEREEAEAGVIEGYLPTLLGEDETRDLVLATIRAEGLDGQGPRAIGAVRKALQGRDDIDLGLVARIAKDAL